MSANLYFLLALKIWKIITQTLIRCRKTFVSSSLTIETEQDAKRYSSEIGIDVFDIIGISGGEKENTKTIAEKKKSFAAQHAADLSAQSLKYSSIKKASPVLSQSFVECVRILADVKGLFAAVTQDRNRVGFTIYLSYMTTRI